MTTVVLEHLQNVNSSGPDLTIDSSGNIGIGDSNNSSYDSNAQNLLLASSGNTGMTIRSAGSTPFAMIHFADGTADLDAKRAGRIIYQHDGDNLTIHTANTERMRIDGSGRVGIGTGGTVNTNAHANADDFVIGNTSNRTGMTIVSDPAQNGNIHFSDGTSTGNADISGQLSYEHSDNSFRFYANSTTEVLRLTSSGGTVFNNGQDINQNFTVKASGNANALFIDGNGGNVGIGTTSPDAIFTVDSNVGGSSTGTIARFHSSKGESDSTYLQIAATRHGTASVQRVQLQAFDDDGSTGRTLALNPSGGNVGIGINVPNAGLEVQGSHIGQDGVNDDFFKALKLSIPDNTEWGGQVQFSVGRWQNSGNHARSSLVIALGHGAQNSTSDADTRVMTLVSSGRVVFSPTGAVDGQGVTTYANGANGHYVSCTGTSNYWITNHGVASATGTLSTFYNNGTYCGGINISSTNVTSYVSASDYRLKENVVPMTGATERLKQLNPVTFDWINSGESSEGFIAHEVGAIVPISTTGTKDEVYDEEGAADNPKINEGDPKYQSVDPANLVPLLVKTIQELEARITQLESA